MFTKRTNNIVSAVLFVVCVGVWYYTYTYYQQHEESIILQLYGTLEKLALPYHIARLSLEEPVAFLSVPVYGVLARDIADTWGEARDEGRTHEGIDIFAPRGTPVFSATRGYVVRLNFGARGGLSVMVTGPGGVRYYYAHLERIAEGVEVGSSVTSDSVLGYVGTSGNASGTPPHLHFGVYTEPRKAVNPHPVLIDRE